MKKSKDDKTVKGESHTKCRLRCLHSESGLKHFYAREHIIMFY